MVPSAAQLPARLTRLVVACAAIGLLAGCPKKIVETIPGEQKPCAPVAAPVEKPTASVKNMVTVAVVKGPDGNDRAVVAAQGYAAVVAQHEKVGSEQATVMLIRTDGITVRMPDRTSRLVPMASELPATEGEPGTDAPDAKPAAMTDEEKKLLEEHVRWRKLVIGGITNGYGVPRHVLVALTAVMSEHKPDATKAALNGLEWKPQPGVSRARLIRIQVHDGKVTVDGDAVNEANFAAILARLKSASPLIRTAKEISKGGAPGYRFRLELTAPLIVANDIAMPGKSGGEKAIPADVLAVLTKASSGMAKNPAMGDFDSELRELAQKSGLGGVQASRMKGSTEEGYLGMVSFELEGTGTIANARTFLRTLQRQGVSKQRVVVDPMTIQGQKIQMTIRVPYVTSNSDARKNARTPILSALDADRWKPVRAQLETLRDPLR